MHTFQPFAVEHMMSTWENVVAYNLSESGAHPIAVRGLVSDATMIGELLATELHEPQTNSTVELRQRIAALLADKLRPASRLRSRGARSHPWVNH